MSRATENVRVAPRQVAKYLAQITIVFAAYFVAGKLGQATSNIRSSNLGPVWPAYGVALAAILVCGYRVWVAIVVAAFLIALLSPVPLVAAVGQAAGATVAVMVGAFLLRRIAKFRPSLSRLGDALALIVLGALGSAMVSATIGVSVLYATHVQAYSGLGSAWLIYWLGDSTGVLLVTPLVLTFPDLLRIRPQVRIAEFAALLLLLAVTCFIIFGDLPLIPVKLHVLAFAVLPFVMWAAIRFGVSGAALSTLFVATIATVETALGSGPFAQNIPFTNAVLLDVFFAVLSVSGVILAAVIAEREQGEREREQLVRKHAAMEARLRLATIVESSDDAIIGEGIDGIVTDWNKGAERLYGYSAGEVIGKPISLLMPPNRASDSAEKMEALRRGSPVKHYETVRQKKDGTPIEVSLTASRIIDAEGRIVGASVIERDITERKRAEKTLRESEERFHLAAQAGNMFAYEWDAATDVIVRSAEAAQILGIDEAAHITGQQILAKVCLDDRERLKVAVAELSPEKPHLRISYRMARPDGTVIWVERNSRAHFDEQGRMLRIVGMVADITDRKLAEERLREYEKAVEGSEEMIAVVDREYRYLIANRKFLSLRNMTKEQVVGRLADEVLNKGVFEAGVKEKLDECFRGKVVRYEVKYTYPELGERDVFVSYVPIEGATGIDRVACILQDITDRKRTEEALRNSEERFRLAAQAGKMYAYEWDVATDKVTRSAEHVSVLGFSDEAKQLTRQQLLVRVHPDDRALFGGSVEELTPQNPTTQISYRVLRPDGSVVWLEKSARAFFDEQGRMLRVIGMVGDIAERKRVEVALRESEDKLRLLLDSTAEAIYGIDIEGRCTFCNPSCLRALGYERVDELLGKNMHDLIHHTRADGSLFPVEECRIFRAFRAGEGAHVDDEVLWRANRTSFPAEYWSYPQRRGQEVVGAVVAFIDITQRKLGEAALANVSRRLIAAHEEERAWIARELHDDVNQRMALLAIELDRWNQQLPDSAVEFHDHIRHASQRLSDIAADIQALSHRLHSSKLEYLGLVAAAKSFCQELSEQQKVEIDFSHTAIPRSVPKEISLCLFRVLQETLQNAVKHSGVRHFKVELSGTEGEIQLTVSDLGVGFEAQDAIHRRGLGLISMRERMQLVSGEFSIKSRPGGGTTIHARVPLRGTDSLPAVG